jgi:superfamily II DNA or RNA helicase
MGLGKTFTGSEKMLRLGGRVNLVICQKSKIDDWLEHFKQHYRWYKKDISANEIFDLTNKDEFGAFIASVKLFCGQVKNMTIGIINYDLMFRRPELLKLKIDTLMLDESSMIQNDRAERTDEKEAE